jgi:glycopeptide antibiotics resistance protein
MACFSDKASAWRWRLEALLVVLILAATAVPFKVRHVTWNNLYLKLNLSDIALNVLFYVPFGIVFAWRGMGRTVLVAFAVSVVAEAMQFFSANRFPGPMDVVCNVAGAIVGVPIGWRWLATSSRGGQKASSVDSRQNGRWAFVRRNAKPTADQRAARQ